MITKYDSEHRPAFEPLMSTKIDFISLDPVHLGAIERVERLAQLFFFESNYSHPEFDE